MYFPDQRILFIHIPKTAGNYIQRHLRQFSPDVVHAHDDKDRFAVTGESPPAKHATAPEYRARMGALFEQCEVFTSVRHPVDRMLSFYFSPHRWQRRVSRFKGHWNRIVTDDPVWDAMKFEEMVASERSMSGYLATALPQLIRYEFLHHQVGDLFARFGVLPDLTAVNRSASTYDWRIHAREAAPIVRKHHAEDFERFGYP